jgi:6-phospho-3-hexuloisomerase
MDSCASLDTYRHILNELSTVAAEIDGRAVDAFVAAIMNARRVFCVGAGRSGIMLSAFCMRLNHLGIDAFVAGGVPCPPAEKGDLIIASSASGTTSTVKAILARGREAGVRTVFFTASECEPQMYDDMTISIRAPSQLINTGAQLSVQPMKALFEQTVFLLCEAVVCTLKEKLEVSDDDMRSRHANLE